MADNHIEDMSEDMSMEDFASMLDSSFKRINNRDIIDAKVMAVNADELLMDVGTYLDGILPVSELLYEGEELSQFKVGDKIRVMVKFVNTREGFVMLSRKEADKSRIWSDLKKSDNVVEVKVLRAVKGGLRVSYRDNEGFMPASQVSMTYVEDLESYVGRVLTAQIMEADEENQNLVFSHKAVERKMQEDAKVSVYMTTKPGTQLTGKVVRLTKFGAFVEIAPHVDGMVHVNEMSWSRVKDPADLLSVGDIVKVTVLDVDQERGRISLSLKDVDADPWQNVNIQTGDLVTGTVTKVIDSGAFVELAPGLEGYVHVSNIAERHISTAASVLHEGDEVTAKVMNVDSDQKRISLSIKAAKVTIKENEEKEQYRAYKAEQEEISTNLGSLLSKLK